MTDYIEREAALAQTREINITEVGYRHRCIDPQAIKEIPAADVVPVVRCKDCKYCIQTDEFEYWCNGFCNPARLVRKEDFCSRGAKMDGET